MEIKELIDRAKNLYSEGKFEEALRMTNSAIQACREAVSQALVFPRKLTERELEKIIFRYLIISIIVSIILGIFYYYFKRARLKKQ